MLLGLRRPQSDSGLGQPYQDSYQQGINIHANRACRWLRLRRCASPRRARDRGGTLVDRLRIT